MSDNSSSPQDAHWLKRLRDPATRDEAATAVYERYSRQLLSLIQSRLAGVTTVSADADDVMQSVFRSFYNKDDFVLKGETLFPFLAEMAVRKSISLIRKMSSEKRSQKKTESFSEDISDQMRKPSDFANRTRYSGQSSEPAPKPAPDANDGLTQEQILMAMFAGATAEQATHVIEMFQILHPELREILVLRLLGHTNEEIAKRCNVVERTIIRKTDLIRSALEKHSSDGFDS